MTGPQQKSVPVKHWSYTIALHGTYSAPDGMENDVRDRIEKKIEGVLLPLSVDGIRLLQQTFSKEEITPAESQEARSPVEPGR